MAKPEPTELVEHIKTNRSEDYRKQEQEKLLHTYSDLPVNEFLEKLSEYTDGEMEDGIRKGLMSCYLGAFYAFRDRELDPFALNHIYLYKIIREDIEEAYNMVNEGNLDPEIWLFETFDYGIKQVYYLDWQLYLSKICY